MPAQDPHIKAVPEQAPALLTYHHTKVYIHLGICM